MAAGKVSVMRRREFSQGSKTDLGFECEGENRCVFEKDCRVRVKEAIMEVDDGVVIPPPEKRRKLSPVVWGEDDMVRSRFYDDQEPGELDEEDYDRTPNIMMSRWVNDDEEDVSEECEEKGGVSAKGGESKGRRSSPESGVTQKEGSDGSDGGYALRGYSEGECSGSEYEEDDLMKVDVSGDEFMDSDEESEAGVCGNGRRDMLQGCRNVFDYEKLGKISEGSYGIVYKARDKKSGEMVALKKMKLGNQREGFPVYYLREINTLMSLNHPSIVNVREVVVDESAEGFDNIYMVMDYVEHDLKALMQARKQHFRQSEVKCLMLQLLEGVSYLHDNWVLHRDLKTSNLLLNNEGELKICDFGMARQYGSPLKPYTSLVVTLWYRAPELLLGAKEYSTAVDMWSVGCIMAELLTNKPLFEGKSEVEQLDKIFRILGTPNDKIWSKFSDLPGSKAKFVNQPYNQLHKKFPRTLFTGSPVLSDSGLDLLSRLLTYDPEKRITAFEALNHPWFQEVPLPNAKEFMPSFPADKVVLAR